MVVEVLFARQLGHLNHSDILGLVGAEAVLVGLVAAVLAGPWAGLATIAAGALAFWVFIADEGETDPTRWTFLGAALWAVSVLTSGFVADSLRQQAAARQRAVQESAALHQQLESALLPLIPESVGGYRTTTLYRPGEHRLGLGGDFYDLELLPDDGLALIIGDVSGHGPHAAALGASLRASWRALVQTGVEPPSLLEVLAHVTVSEAASADLFATAWLGWIDRGGRNLLMGSLGHPPPLLLTDDVRFIEPRPTAPLGVLPHAEWSPTQMRLPATWTLILYTDGLVEGREAPGSDARFGPERLRAWFAAHSKAGIDAGTLQQLVVALEGANGGLLPDDIAVLSITRPPHTN